LRQASRLRVVLIGALLCLAIPASFAVAMELDEAKARGWVGERPDGFLGVVDAASAPKAAQALVDDINRRRRERYDAIAKQEGTTLEIVAALAGKKLIDRTPSGQYVMNESGEWLRK